MRFRRTKVLGLAAGGSLAIAGIAAAHGSPGGGKPTTTPPPPCRGNGHDPHGNGLGHGNGNAYGHCDGDGGHDDGRGGGDDGQGGGNSGHDWGSGITLSWSNQGWGPGVSGND